jgi:hypothetical protein
MSNPGSRRLVFAASSRGADELRGLPLPPEQVERRRRTPIEQNYGRHLLPGYNGFNVRKWTEEEDEWLATLSPAEVVQRTGRSLLAVYGRRSMLRTALGLLDRWRQYAGEVAVTSHKSLLQTGTTRSREGVTGSGSPLMRPKTLPGSESHTGRLEGV